MHREVLEAALRSKSIADRAAGCDVCSATTAVKPAAFEWDTNKNTGDDCNNNNGSDSRDMDKFFDGLRGFLLRIRVAGQLRQDLVAERHFSELKTLCRGVCAELGTTAVLQELWALVCSEPISSATGDRQASSLKRDAEIVSRAREILQKAADATCRSNDIVSETRARGSDLLCARRRHLPRLGRSLVPTSSDGTQREERLSSQPSQRDPSRGPNDAFQDPADVFPLRDLAEALGVSPAKDAYLGFVGTNEQALADTTKMCFDHPTSTKTPPPMPAPVDWNLAVHRLLLRQKNTTTKVVVPIVEPLLPSSPEKPATRESLPLSLPLSPSSTASSTSSSSLQATQRTKHFVWRGRVRGGRPAAAMSAEQPARCSGDEIGGENASRKADCRQDCFSPRLERKQEARRTESCESRGVSVGKLGRIVGDDDVTTAPPGVTARTEVETDRRTKTLTRKRVPRRELSRALESSPPRLRRVSWHVPLATSPPPPPPSPPPPPPPWPREDWAEAKLRDLDEETNNGRARGPSIVEGGVCKEARRRRETREGLVAPPSPRVWSVGRRRGGEVRYSRRQEQVSGDDASDDGDVVCCTPKLSKHNSEEEQEFLQDVLENEVDGWGGRGGGDIKGQRCSGCYFAESDDFEDFRDERNSLDTLRGPDAEARTIKHAQTTARGCHTAFQTRTGTHADMHRFYRPPWPLGVTFDGGTSRHRCNSSNKSWDGGGCEGLGDAGDEGGGESPKSSNSTRPRGVSSPAGEEKKGDHDDDDESSCALARKRALLRVRLARQRKVLAAAVVDAIERGLRAERRRRREEKLGALLMKAQRNEDLCVGRGSGAGSDDKAAEGGRRNAMGWRLVPVRNKGGSKRGGERGDSTLKRSGRRYFGVGGGVPQNGSTDGEIYRMVAEGRREEQAEEDEDRIPRQPLKVVPVAAADGSRLGRSSRWGGWKMVGKEEEEEEEEDREKKECRNCGGGGESVAVDRSCSCARQFSTPFSVVVRMDALYISHTGHFGGKERDIELYLVLEAGQSRYRTMMQRRQETGRATNSHSHIRNAFRTNEGEMDGPGSDRGGSGGGKFDDPTRVSVGAWVFRETIGLRLSAAEGEGEGKHHVRGMLWPEDDGENSTASNFFSDNVLCVRVWAAGKHRPPRGLFSCCPCPSSRRRLVPTRQGRDTTPGAAAGATPDELVGSATITLLRFVASAGGGGGSNGGMSENELCTFARSMKASVVSPEGLAIGWIEFGVCGTTASLEPE